MLIDLKEDVNKAADPEKGKFLMRFFKTGVGQYGENDVFYGLTVPQSRVLALKYKDLSLQDIEKLLQSKVHEERLIALLVLVHAFNKGDEKARREIYDFYLAHTKYINNWDLVDLSADKIVGEYVLRVSGVSRALLVKLAQSENLWERRISIVATYTFIKNGEYADTFKIADILLDGPSASSGRRVAPHDLIQKAVGWMLREVGKRISEEKLEEFLQTRYKTMPRTMLRYAIERFSEEKRRKYLKGEIYSTSNR